MTENVHTCPLSIIISIILTRASFSLSIEPIFTPKPSRNRIKSIKTRNLTIQHRIMIQNLIKEIGGKGRTHGRHRDFQR